MFKAKSPRLAALLIWLLVLNVFSSSAFAADKHIDASPDGPGMSLQYEGLSPCLLSSLKRQDGSEISPETVRKINDNFLRLPAGSKPDCAAYKQFICKERAINGESHGNCGISTTSSAPVEPGKGRIIPPETTHALKPGESISFVAFRREDGSVDKDIRFEPSAPQGVKFTQVNGTVTIAVDNTAQAGITTFTLRVGDDQSVKRQVTVRVLPSEDTTGKDKGHGVGKFLGAKDSSTPFTMLLLVFSLMLAAFLLRLVLVVLRRLRFRRRRVNREPVPQEPAEQPTPVINRPVTPLRGGVPVPRGQVAAPRPRGAVAAPRPRI